MCYIWFHVAQLNMGGCCEKETKTEPPAVSTPMGTLVATNPHQVQLQIETDNRPLPAVPAVPSSPCKYGTVIWYNTIKFHEIYIIIYSQMIVIYQYKNGYVDNINLITKIQYYFSLQ